MLGDIPKKGLFIKR